MIRFEQMTQPKDPTKAQIAAACKRIQAGWSPAECLRRLRVDLWPTVMGADGIPCDVTAESYEAHHQREGVQNENL